MIILLDPPVTDIIVVYRFYDSLDDRLQGSPKSALRPYHVSVDGTEEWNRCSGSAEWKLGIISGDMDGRIECLGVFNK